MTKEETVARIFANLVASGKYQSGDYMCNVLGYAYRAGHIQDAEYELCMSAIREFIVQLRPNYAEYYSCINSALAAVLKLRLQDRKLPDVDYVIIRNVILAIYKDWANRFDHVLRLDKLLKETYMYTDKGYLI